MWKEGNVDRFVRKLRHRPSAPGSTRPGRVVGVRSVPWLRRNVDRLRPLDEAAAYARCHGQRDDSVRVVHLPPRRRRYDDLLATGEEIRRRFEELIDAREVEQPL